MNQIEVRRYGAEHFDDTRALWCEAFPDDPPWNAAEVAIPAKMAVQPDLFLLALHQGRVVGSALAGYDGHRGWLYLVAVLHSYRRRGVGTLLVRDAERRLREIGCFKINLQVRTENAVVVAFYERLGYVVENRVSLGKRFPA